jgi:hypothetical protein
MRPPIIAAFLLVATGLRSVRAQDPPPQPADSTVTIGFENVNSDGLGEPNHTRVANDYPGVTFDHPFVVDFSKGRQAPAFPHGGTRAIMLCDLGVACSERGFEMRFIQPQKRVRVWVGALFLRQNAAISITAMDAKGAIVARTEDTVVADAVRHIGTALDVQTDSNRIASVRIQSDNPDGAYLAFDDVEFERAPSASVIVAEVGENPVVDTLVPVPPGVKESVPWWRDWWLPVLTVILLVGAGSAATKHWMKARLPSVKPRLADSGIDKRIASVQEREPMNLSIKLSLRPGSTRGGSDLDQGQRPQVEQ